MAGPDERNQQRKSAPGQKARPTEEFDQRADKYVENVATGPTVGLKHSKQLLQRGLDRSFDEAIDAEVDAIGATFETEDFAEGVEAFLEQRTPSFDGE